MKQSIREKLDFLTSRLAELDRELSSPEVAADMDSFRPLGRERAEIEPVVSLYSAYRQTEEDCESALGMLSDPELRELAESELEEGAESIASLEGELQRALLPRDPNDDRNLFLEVRAGTGG